ncbi:hypothetical protein K3495_g3337 [Podosphaera aphanis]|nr:hypothetical protein K3495_g3337 [Podosphaera aphanis]
MTLPSTIDLTLSKSMVATHIQDWQTLEIGSDHQGILFTFLQQGEFDPVTPPNRARFNTFTAGWPKFEKLCKRLFKESNLFSSDIFRNLDQLKTIEILQESTQKIDILDQVCQEMTDIILRAAELAIPKTRPGAKPKPWWTEELKHLRKNMMKAQRKLFSDDSDTAIKEEYLSTKNIYFREIKTAKKDVGTNF